MNRSLRHAAFFVGLLAVGWVGAGYVPSNPLALAMTVLIAVFYVMGALELRRFEQATASLARAVADLRDPPAGLDRWLEAVHPSLRNGVRLRVEGERVALPGPAMAPYLAGLLVLLGMLGTFLGMVVTLNGTGMALDSATDLPAIRASLSTPVKGLGLAFGTSVAGVAASAVLGLLAAWCRRDRLQAAQALDARIATTLRSFSRAHQRDESFKLLQRQAEVMPALVDRLQAMMETMERQSQALNERLVAGEESFHGRTEAAYAALAASVDRSLRESLTESARVAGATIQPVVEATMSGIARETTALHARFAGTFDERSASLLDTVARTHAASQADMAAAVSGLARETASLHERLASETHRALAAAAADFEQRSASLVRTVDDAHAGLQASLASRDEQRLAAWTQALESMAASLQREWQQAGAQALGQQQAVCRTLEQTARDITAQAEAHARETIDEITRLVKAASEAPRAAADVIAELRDKLSDSMARDNAVLEERARIMETLARLLEAVNHASTEQRAAIDALVASSADVMDRVGVRFTESVDAHTDRLSAVAAQVTGSAVEVSSLGEAFGFAVQLFSESNDKLAAQLQRIEGALGKSIARSDEQLAYYVAQAREIIDLSIMSQKQIVEDLQRLASRRAPAVAEA